MKGRLSNEAEAALLPGLKVKCPVAYCQAMPSMRCLRRMTATTTISLPGLQFMRSNESHKARRELEVICKDV